MSRYPTRRQVFETLAVFGTPLAVLAVYAGLLVGEQVTAIRRLPSGHHLSSLDRATPTRSLFRSPEGTIPR